MTPFAAAFLVAMAVVLAVGQSFINYMRSKKTLQPISPDAPEKHRLKHGTPTMGGILIISAVTIATVATLLLAKLDGSQKARILLVLGAFLGAGVVGYLDDRGKAAKKENRGGLSERAKLALQLVVAGGFVFGLTRVEQAGITTALNLFGWHVDLGVAYYGLAILFVMGFSNAVNFADGLDGLAAGTTLIATVALGIACSMGALFTEMLVFWGAIAGGCAAFLWFNSYPARVFMGDTGSLALGVGLAAGAIAAKQEVLVLIIGLIYLLEIFSMMIQRYVFKYRRIRFGLEYAQNNRVFRRAPLHHHFEELGWHETQVVGRFYVLCLIFAAVGLLIAPMLSIGGMTR
ncbi:MAG: phospho-N-acetylmuramoyl-pentapeptide-transferase [Armatimonas sp.]